MEIQENNRTSKTFTQVYNDCETHKKIKSIILAIKVGFHPSESIHAKLIAQQLLIQKWYGFFISCWIAKIIGRRCSHVSFFISIWIMKIIEGRPCHVEKYLKISKVRNRWLWSFISIIECKNNNKSTSKWCLMISRSNVTSSK